MKIVSIDTWAGAAGRQFGDGAVSRELRNELAGAGHSVTHIGVNPFSETLEYEGTVWRIPGHYKEAGERRATDQPDAFMKAVEDLNDLVLPIIQLAAHTADVIHLHTELATPATKKYRRSSEIPVVYTQHTVNRVQLVLSRCNQAVAEFLISLQEETIDFADGWTAPSALVPKSNRMPVVIPHAVKYNDVPAPDRTADTVPTVLYVGRLTAIKGIDLLLDALRLVTHDYRLVVVGTGPNLSEYRHRARALGIPAQFTGHLPHRDIWNLYAASAIFVCPTEFETYNLAVDEAMAGGLAVIASDIEPFRERIESGVTGILCPRNAESFARWINYLIGSPEERRKMGEAGSRRIASRGAVGVASRYLAVYSHALEVARGSHAPHE